MHSFQAPETTGPPAGGKGAAPTANTAGTGLGPVPVTCLLSNGRYHAMVTDSGGGYSRWNGSALTRWREDTTRDHWGVFFYLRDVTTGAFWSSTFQPTCNRAVHYRSDFSGGYARQESSVSDVGTLTDFAVSPCDDVELHRMTIFNHSGDHKLIDITSYAEVVLAPPANDDAHPAFSKLFIQTEIIDHPKAILCHRRSGGSDSNEPWMFHMVVAGVAASSDISCETDRARFLGRGGTPASPLAIRRREPKLSGSQGSVLDPIVAIRCPLRLRPGQSAEITYILGAGESREACLAMIARYAHGNSRIETGFRLARERRQQMTRDLAAGPEDMQWFARLADSILYSNALMRADPSIIARNRQGQPSLWPMAISGDLPIVLLQLGSSPDQGFVRRILAAHYFWHLNGLKVDLVICDRTPCGNRQAAQDAVADMISGDGHRPGLAERPGGVFVRVAPALSVADRDLLQAVARVVLDDTADAPAGWLGKHGRSASSIEPVASCARVPWETIEPDTAPTPGVGGFAPDGREYVITLEPGQSTPTPWVNILANPGFGSIVSESGCASTWSENAHEFRLTPWDNDPVGDSIGEAFYLRDEKSDLVWSPTPWPRRGSGQYLCRHGFGYSVFTHTEEGIHSEFRVYVAHDSPVKFAVLRVHNRSGRRRSLSATGYIEWVLGDLRTKTMQQITTRVDTDSHALVARNAYSTEFSEWLAYFTADEPVSSLTADRASFLGRGGRPECPAALAQARLDGRTGAALDPCAAIRVPFELEDDSTREVVFKLGAVSGEEELHDMLRRFEQPAAVHDALDQVKDFWDETLGAVQVHTPDAALDFLANGWLVYQTLACRLWARNAFYQSSGAFGFRDQLQDVMALVHTKPELVRAHILLCASRQFLEGDVQHWWHPPQGRGVRTRCSDDFLWLVLATCRYVASTGDEGVLDEPVHFLTGRPLKPDEVSVYDLPGQSPDPATLYEHCVRAIEHGFRFGAHGLPLMGTGDWNDGMNKVGAQGQGESVWLAFFLYDVLRQFRVLAHSRHDARFIARCDEVAAGLRRNIEQHGWDGAWYRRAYFDDGSPLGSAMNAECRIDSLAQSWSVLSGAAEIERARKAMQAVDEQLVEYDNALIRLLTPPFDTSVPDPGYIRAYVPGVRENGGQYTHAAVWVAMAFAALKDNDRAWRLLSMLNPVHHGAGAEAVSRYKVEPYVIASDVYAGPLHSGRGGWTWYSGSAGWFYRLIVESILGLRREARTLRIDPCIPTHWTLFRMDYRFGATHYHIAVRRRATTAGMPSVSVDGTEQESQAIPLLDDGCDHHVEVLIDHTGDTGCRSA